MIKSKMALSDADEAYKRDRLNDNYGTWEVKAAYNLSMAVEYVLKALMYGEGVLPLKLHQPEMLIAACQYYKVSVPKSVENIAGILREFESASRYDADFDLDEGEFIDVYNIADKYISKVWNTVVPLIVAELQKYTPPSIVNADMSIRLFKQNIRYLPEVDFKDCVDSAEIWRRVKSKRR